MTLRTRTAPCIALSFILSLSALPAQAPAATAADGDVTVAVIGTAQTEVQLGTTRQMCVIPLAVVPVPADGIDAIAAPLMAARAAGAPILVQTVTVDAQSAIPAIRLGRIVTLGDDGKNDLQLEQLRVSVVGKAEGYETRTLRFSILMPQSGWKLDVVRAERNHEAVRPHLVLSQRGLALPVLEEVHAELAIGDAELLYAATYLARVAVEGKEPVFELVDLLRLL